MKRKIIVGTNTLLQMAKNLAKKGEISLEQFAVMVNRNKHKVPKEHKKDVVDIDEDEYVPDCDYGNIS